MKNALLKFAGLAFMLLAFSSGFAQKQTFVRDYTYRASDVDSRVTSRTNATTEMRNILLREVGDFLQSEQTLIRQSVMKNGKEEFSEDFSKKIEAITAGIIEMKVLDEKWNGETYYIQAEMAVDPAEVSKRIAEVMNDKQKTQELEDARRRLQEAEAEARKWQQEAEKYKTQAAQQTYQKQVDKLSAEEYFTRAYNADESGFYELAIEYYQKAVSINPEYVNAYYNMGIDYHNLENYTQAISCYQKAVSIDPSDAFAYSSMGFAYARLENYTQAISCFQRAISIDPNLTGTYNNMGNAYSALGKCTQAIKCYQKAVSIDPNYALAYYNMGLTYDELKNYTQAINCFQKAARLEHREAQEWLKENGYKW